MKIIKRKVTVENLIKCSNFQRIMMAFLFSERQSGPLCQCNEFQALKIELGLLQLAVACSCSEAKAGSLFMRKKQQRPQRILRHYSHMQLTTEFDLEKRTPVVVSLN